MGVTGESEAAGKRSAASPGEREYGKRNLHVVMQDEGIQLYIRDQQVAAHQLPALVSALQGQLSAPGHALLGVYLNGKPVSGRTVGAFEDAVADMETERTEHIADAPSWPSLVNRSEE
jgi:hypothetical protein